MSIKALTWARDLTAGTSTRKLVLMALADRANDEAGWVTFVGQESLARECELSRRTVVRALAELEAIGAIRRERRVRSDGTRTSDAISLNPEWKGLSDTVSHDTDGLGDTESRDTERVANVTLTTRQRDTVSQQEQEVNGKKNGKYPPTPHDDLFADFWSVYPRRVAKRSARTAYERALKRADPEAILAGAIRYRDDPKRKPDYTAHPTTWLNGDRWSDDDTEPSRGTEPRGLTGIRAMLEGGAA